MSMRDLWMGATVQHEEGGDGAKAELTVTAVTGARLAVGWISVANSAAAKDVTGIIVRDTDDSGTILAHLGSLNASDGAVGFYPFNFGLKATKGEALYIEATGETNKAEIVVCYTPV